MTLDVVGSDTVNAVLDMYIEKGGLDQVPKEILRLSFRGKQLEGNRTLSDYNVQRESELHVLIHIGREQIFQQQVMPKIICFDL
jgi:hypothetical protein